MEDILFLAHRLPYPPDRGDRIRSWNILKHLAALARVHLGCFVDDEADHAHLENLREALGDALGEIHVERRRRSRLTAGVDALSSGKPILLTAFSSSGLPAFVQDVLSRKPVGTVYAYSVQMAQFVPHGIGQRFIMDFVDMDSAKFAAYADQAKPPMRWVYRREAARLLAFEKATAGRADASLFVTEAETTLFRRASGLPHADIHVLENGVDLDFYHPAASFEPLDEQKAGPLLVFTGQMDYQPNVEAVTDFARTAFPRIVAEIPAARFAIVGRRPVEAVRRLAVDPGITVTGEVPDVRAWLAAADLVVAPLRTARGLQNKVLEAMAMGRPVVASPPAFEGISAIPGRDLIVAPAKGQAAMIVELLRSPGSLAALGAAARRQMEARYRWSATLRPLGELLSQPHRREAA